MTVVTMPSVEELCHDQSTPANQHLGLLALQRL
jgi:hypothetical protein